MILSESDYLFMVRNNIQSGMHRNARMHGEGWTLERAIMATYALCKTNDLINEFSKVELAAWILRGAPLVYSQEQAMQYWKDIYHADFHRPNQHRLDQSILAIKRIWGTADAKDMEDTDEAENIQFLNLFILNLIDRHKLSGRSSEPINQVRSIESIEPIGPIQNFY